MVEPSNIYMVSKPKSRGSNLVSDIYLDNLPYVVPNGLFAPYLSVSSLKHLLVCEGKC